MMRLVPPALALCLAILGCRRAEVPADPEPAAGLAWFADVTRAHGIDVVLDAGPTGKYFMPQSVGAGAALHDLDRDGLPDLLVLHNGGPGGKKNQLFRQRPDRTFEDVSAGSGLDFAGHCMGVAVGDINNDGLPDVVITAYGGSRLFLNLGRMRFREITREAGIDSPLWGASAAFVDIDGDGFLDLLIVNYVDYDPSWPCSTPGGLPDFCAPKVFKGTASKLYRNRGVGADGKVTFEDISFSSGVGTRAAPGLGVVCADLTGGGRQDLFIANDGAPNHLWVNKGKGVFAEEAVSRGVAYTAMGQAFAGMGVAVGDVGGDGLLDLFVTHLGSETNTLWKQGPRGLFRDKSADFGLTRTHWRGTGFGAALADFDHDGRLDLTLINGRVQRGGPAKDSGLPAFWETYGERNQLLAGTAGGFRDLSLDCPALCGGYNVGRGLCVGDIDGDGALDLVITSVAGPVRLLRNVVPDRGHWVIVRAFEPRLKRDALGATVTARAGDRRWIRLVTSASGFLCASPPEVHFGLGKADRIDAFEVIWADGVRESFAGGAVDSRIELRRGEGKR
jgi:enediyne biosynthesis protein E4